MDGTPAAASDDSFIASDRHVDQKGGAKLNFTDRSDLGGRAPLDSVPSHYCSMLSPRRNGFLGAKSAGFSVSGSRER